MRIIGNTVYNDEAVPAAAITRSGAPMPEASPFRSAYRAPGAKGLGELTYNGYSRLHARVVRGILKNALLSLLLCAALVAVSAAVFLAVRDGGHSDALPVFAVPLLCALSIVYIVIGVVNDTRSDLARLRREKKRLSRSAAARIERESGRRRLSALVTLSAAVALLAALNAIGLA